MSRLLPWQDALWQRVYQQRDEGRLPHALLLTGPHGIGKLDFAEHLASSLLCNAPTDAGPCGSCRSCTLMSTGNHPDLLHLTPEEAGKVIKVDQVREVIDKLHGTAQQGGYRVLIVAPAEEMNISAANALLKTLEEPGNETMILLVVHQLGQVMPTIRSRCQRIEFALPPVAQATEWLQTETGVDLKEAKGLLSVAQGAPLEARAWKQNEAMELRAKFLSGLADTLRGRVTPIQLADSLQKEDVLQLLNWWISLLNDILQMQVAKAEAPRTNPDMKSMASALSGRVAAEQLFSFSDQLIEERKGLLKHTNPNKQLLLEKLLLRWKAL